jgi:hypothetical protein
MANVFFDESELLKLGMSNAMVTAIKNAVTINMDDYACLNYAGNPNNNVTSNYSRLCVDTTGGQMYFNPDVNVDTGWVAV